MTLATQTSRVDYRGNNCTTAYAYTFKVPESSDLQVYVGGVLKTLTADYSVSGAGSASGGTVTFVTAPGCDVAVAIVRNVAYTQSTDYPENGPFPAESHEDALDKLTMLVQQVFGIAKRAIRFAAGSPKAAEGWEVDEPIGGRYPRSKSDCTGIEWVALESCGTYENPVTTKGDTIQGNDAGVQERLALGTMGYVATSGPLAKVVWAPSGAVLLRNKTDAQADPGRFYALAEDCDSAFVVSDAAGCARVGIITGPAVGDDCLGLVLYDGGPVTMPASGNIARGQWVRKAATAGAVQTTCVYHTEFRPIPKGAIGLAIGHSAGGCVAVLKLPVPSSGAQDFPAVRNNQSISVSATPCTQVTLIADYLKLADSCLDVVVIKAPANVTNNICTSFTNKKNGRDNTESGQGLQPGDVHFYWVYEGTSGTVSSRSSSKGPNTSGPELPACETHWAYSHSLYWDSNCLRKHTVRGATVYFDCTDSTKVLVAGAATCETRVSLIGVVPAIATRVHLLADVVTTGTVSPQSLFLGYRVNCINYAMTPMLQTGNVALGGDLEVTIPNVNQEVYYRWTVAGSLTLSVIGFDVPNGD